MPRLRFGPGLVIALGFAGFGIGCGKGVEIVRAPFISPIVVPAPEVFRMNVAVKNYGNTASTDLWLKVYSEYWPKANPGPGEPPCSQSEYLHVGALAPNQGWAKSDYRIDRDTGCQCVKNSCPGHVWLSLHVAPQYPKPLDGVNTRLHVNWAADGELSKMTISTF